MRVVLLRSVLLCAAAIPLWPQGLISTYAGTDWIFQGDGRRALDAPLGSMYGLAADPAGNIYAADYDNHIVVRVDPNGTLTVVAGNGVRGFSGDGGQARNASLTNPHDVLIDPAGNIFIAERLGHRIRKVTPDGRISTIAGTGRSGFTGDGGPATEARLNQPRSLAMDKDGNLYVLDRDNGRIRKIDKQGIITTYAGNGSLSFGGDGGSALQASFYPQFGIAIDASNNLYISDFENNRIRRVDSRGIITTIAGTGVCGASDDGVRAVTSPICIPRGITVDAEGNIYFLDNNRLRKINPVGIITTVAGTGKFFFGGDGGPATQAFLRSPYGVTIDPSRNIYIADRDNLRIRKVTPQGTISTIAGNARFRQVNDNTPASTAFFYFPKGMAFDSSGNLFVADYGNNRIRRITPAGVFSTYAGPDSNNCCVVDGQRRDPLISLPLAIVFDGRQNLIFSDYNAARVRRISPNGVIDTIAGDEDSDVPYNGDNRSAVGAALNYPAGLVFDSLGNLYIADSENHRVRRVNAAGLITTFAGNGTNGYAGDGGQATQASLREPFGLAIDRAGNLLIADIADHRVRRVTPAGIISTIAGTGNDDSTGDGGQATQATLSEPSALAIDADGNIYVAEEGGNRVRRISPDGRISALAGTGVPGFAGDGGLSPAARLAAPRGLAFDSKGTLYIGDTDNHRIRIVRGVSPVLQVSPASLSLSGTAGGPALTSTLRVSADFAGLQFTAAASTQSAGSWLRVEPAGGATPMDLTVTADVASLEPGQYTGAITVASPQATPPSRRVEVTLTVLPSLPPKLSVGSQSLTFSFVRGGPPSGISLSVINLGGGNLDFQASASTTAGGGWLTASPESGTTSQASPAFVMVTANPAGLAAGVYTGVVAITGGPDEVRLAVTMTISQNPGKILLSQNGLSFVAVAGGGAPSAQSIGILNEAQGSLSWEAKVMTLAGGDWLSVSQGSGQVQRPLLDVSLLDVRVNGSGLAPGDYYGRVEITAQTDNSPQYCTVVLRVLPEGSNPGPEVRPAGLIFTGLQGSSPGSENVGVTNLQGQTTTFASSRLTFDGANWFSHTPANAAVAPNEPGRIVVQPDYSALTPGVRRGALTLQFEDGTIRTVSLLTVVAPEGSADKAARGAAGCGSTNLRVEMTSLREDFVAVIGQPATIESRVVDDCGNLLVYSTGARVIASFTNGDPEISMTHTGGGIWDATWRPVRGTTGRTIITLTAVFAEGSVRQIGQLRRSGTLVASSTPIVPPGALRHAASFATEAPVAPGTLITILGLNLAERVTEAGNLPLPLQLDDTEVLLAGRPLPLLYSSTNQINAQIPYGLPVNTAQQLVVRRGSTLSVPESFTVAAAQPGIFTKNAQGFGQAFALKADGTTLAEPGSPAEHGEVVTLFCTGLGEVDPPVPPGEAAPSPAPATVMPVSVTVGGVAAAVRFSGLTPGFAGRYQVVLVVPPDAPAGDDVPLVVTAAGRASQAATMAVR